MVSTYIPRISWRKKKIHNSFLKFDIFKKNSISVLCLCIYICLNPPPPPPTWQILAGPGSRRAWFSRPFSLRVARHHVESPRLVGDGSHHFGSTRPHSAASPCHVGGRRLAAVSRSCRGHRRGQQCSPRRIPYGVSTNPKRGRGRGARRCANR